VRCEDRWATLITEAAWRDGERLCDRTSSRLEDEIARAFSGRSKWYGAGGLSPSDRRACDECAAWMLIAFTISRAGDCTIGIDPACEI